MLCTVTPSPGTCTCHAQTVLEKEVRKVKFNESCHRRDLKKSLAELKEKYQASQNKAYALALANDTLTAKLKVVLQSSESRIRKCKVQEQEITRLRLLVLKWAS